MAEPEVGVRDLLVAASVGVFNATSGWSIHIGGLPEGPDTAIAVSHTGGLNPNPHWLLDYPSVQVLVRGDASGYVAAKAKATEVKDVLLGLVSQTINGDRWDSIRMLGDIGWLGFDSAEKRPIFSVNLTLIIEPIASAETNRIPL